MDVTDWLHISVLFALAAIITGITAVGFATWSIVLSNKAIREINKAVREVSEIN